MAPTDGNRLITAGSSWAWRDRSLRGGGAPAHTRDRGIIALVTLAGVD